MHNLYEAYRRMYDALDVKNIDSILPPPQPPAPKDPATENGLALKGQQLQAFPQQDSMAHIRVHVAMIQSPAIQANPQAFLILQAHIQDHVSIFALDVIKEMLEKGIQESIAAGQQPPQINPDAAEAAVAQQIAETLEQLAPMLKPQTPPDPLVQIRQQELQNDTAEIQRKMQNDALDFQIDQAKLQQSYDLAMQRQALQEQIANDRNDVNVYRINTQADLKRDR
jgi:hypothetical protein